MPAGSGVSSLPLGPWTEIRLPWMLTFTPWGIAIGFFPIRDICSLTSVGSRLAPAVRGFSVNLSWRRYATPVLRALPDLAEDFAAHAFFAGLATGHHAARGGEDVDPHPGQHARNLVAADVDAAAG